MEASTIVGAIGIIATLCAPIVGVITARWSKNRHLNRISEDRKAALEGDWRGTGIQEGGPGDEPLQTEISAKCKVFKREVVGDFNYEYKLNNKNVLLKMKLTGGFLYERYLRLYYNNQEATMINFGSAVFELDDLGTKLSGRFVGYGSIARGLVFGSIELQKQKQSE